MHYYVLETTLKTSPKNIESIRRKIAPIEGKRDDIWHNHDLDDGKTIHRYPSIQYKIINGKFSIVTLPYGEKTLFEFIKKMPINSMRGNKMDMFRLEKFPLNITPTDKTNAYRCENWLPMSSDMYEVYLNLCKELNEKPQNRYISHPVILTFFATLLHEQILKNAFSLGVIIAPDLVELTITTDQIKHTLASVRGMKFSKISELSFEINLDWPIHLGVGKGTAIGFGMLRKVNN